MYRYLFTNDLRISTLNESLQKAGECFLENKVPTAQEDKSANNNMKTLGFYFNLTCKGACARAASEGKIREVVFNFIKKFQFPNMRTSEAHSNSVADGITLAPMRMILSVLYAMNLLYSGAIAYLTRDEVKNFIFYNEDVAKTKNPNLIELISQIVEYRRTGVLPTNIDTDENNHEWKQEDRQLREMIKILTWSGCVEEDGDKIRINNDNLTRDNKADIYDIINYKGFWVGTTLESYQQYMDLSEEDTNQDRNDEIDIEEYNKKRFRLWMENQVKPSENSDAGEPYSEYSIDQYVSNIANTQINDRDDKSLFTTTDVDIIAARMGEIAEGDAKNHTQKSAIRKYLEFANSVSPEEDYDDIFNHSLYGMHIKRENESLSEEHPHICIGWSALGDLARITDKNELSEVYSKHFDKGARGKGQDVGQIWRFLNDVQIGDYVIYAESDKFHIGKVVSDYYYDNTTYEHQDEDYKNARKVKWLKKNISRRDISESFHNSLMTAMSIFTINDYKSVVYELLKGTYEKDNISEEEDRMKPDYKTGIRISFDNDIDNDVKRRILERNRIVFGAPGTGKSFLLNEDKEILLSGTEGSFERVTFHPDYTYSQFVGTYKPIMDEDGNGIRYDFVPGPFVRVFVAAMKSALSDNPQPHLLLIEEINRAKVAAVFGDVFQLLDRDSDGVSEYEVQTTEDIRRYLTKEFSGQSIDFDRIRIPDNMFIWSTMNSADQGVYPMDTAFKRRWNFEYLGINEKETDIDGIGKIKIANYDGDISWNKLRKAINAKMSSNEFRINEDKLMGPYFLSKKVIASDENGYIKDKKKFIDAFKSKVIMYLYEDAVKQSKHKFFDSKYSSKYSSVCEAFDTVGMDIFGSSFVNLYYEEKGIDAE